MANYSAFGLLDRRSFVMKVAGAAAAASIAWPSASDAQGVGLSKSVSPPPKPIPGGIELAPGFVIHIFGPGDPAVTLPFTGITLQGLDVEPLTITDFKGASALAYHVGTVRGSDGRTYNLETDIRAFDGEYVAQGSVRRGSFALI